MKIQYFNKHTQVIEEEKVYGVKAVKWLYQSPLGRAISDVAARPAISQLYGDLQSSAWSRKKVNPFIKKFAINMDDFEVEQNCTQENPYSSFNQFFIRRFKSGKRPFIQEQNIMPAFCEARYLGYEKTRDEMTFPVKGSHLRAKDLLGPQKTKWDDTFAGGPLMIARLCPVDYHRFHFPDDGHIVDSFPVPGSYHSVNPIALKEKPDIFITNERFVTILDTKNFGKLAYIEVGATCVGKIVQSRSLQGSFARGEEKGYFLFGGSTVVLLGEPGRWRPSDLVIEHTSNNLEVYQHLGSDLAIADLK